MTWAWVKTVQALGVLLDRAEMGAALIVAPTSVGINWVREVNVSRLIAATLVS